jgi:hypothetical protein
MWSPLHVSLIASLLVSLVALGRSLHMCTTFKASRLAVSPFSGQCYAKPAVGCLTTAAAVCAAAYYRRCRRRSGRPALQSTRSSEAAQSQCTRYPLALPAPGLPRQHRCCWCLKTQVVSERTPKASDPGAVLASDLRWAVSDHSRMQYSALTLAEAQPPAHASTCVRMIRTSQARWHVADQVPSL